AFKDYDLILTNPPFGTKKGGERPTRDDLTFPSSNKQLNFLQVIYRSLRPNGKSRAAVVLPDNVLFQEGDGQKVRVDLMNKCNLHTILRLPTGIFYAQGVKANVLFFDRKPASEAPWTKTLWIYDLRTNKNFTLKTNQLTRQDLDEFVACYHPENRYDRRPTWSENHPDGRWRAFTYDELMARDKVNLDIFWLRDETLEDSANLPDPDVLAGEIVEELGAALEQFASIYEELGEE
ncbi:MAG TPA: N-6 DNA methylase, partial [Anaerolineales bacterium]|nr:N-6 DNA methylase [Anaerolineales bacterium]